MPDINHDTYDHTGVPGVPVAAPEPWALMPYLGGGHGQLERLPAANDAIYVPAHPLMAAATLTGIRLRVGTQSGNISVGLYDGSGNRVATSGAVACPASGMAEVNFTSSYAASAGRYYLGISCDNTTATFSKPMSTIGPPATARRETSAHPLPATIGTTDENSAVNLVGRISGGFP